MKRVTGWTTIALAVGGLAMGAESGGCGGAASDSEGSPRARSSVPAPWVRARATKGIALVEMPAQALPSPQASGAVAPPFAARIVKVSTQPGEQVERGAPIVEVVMSQVVAAAGAWSGARARLEAYGRRKAQLETLKADGLARLAELAEVETKIAEAQADRQAALATLRGAGLGPDDVERLLDGTGAIALRSPIAGVVVELHASVGETRDPAGGPIARIAGEAAPRIEARVSHRFPPSAKFEFVPPGGDALPVRLLRQAPLVDPRDGTVLSWFELTGGARPPAGQSGKLRVVTAPGVVAVAAAAVGLEGGRSFVIARPDRRVAVRVLAASGSDALVEGAIAVGDEVAAEPEAEESAGGGGR